MRNQIQKMCAVVMQCPVPMTATDKAFRPIYSWFLMEGQCLHVRCLCVWTGTVGPSADPTHVSEAEMDLLGMDTWWAADVERIFLGIYTVELLIRLTAGGREAFQNSWFWCLGHCTACFVFICWHALACFVFILVEFGHGWAGFQLAFSMGFTFDEHVLYELPLSRLAKQPNRSGLALGRTKRVLRNMSMFCLGGLV